MYLTYEATIAASGATLVRIPASAEDGFRPRVEDIEAAVTSRTRAIFMANPNNPTGTVMTEAELMRVADVVRRRDLWVVVDEVYDSLVFDGVHRGFRALPGMDERTVAIGSLSKSHAMTGWRVGWLVGPKTMVDHVERLALNMLYGLPGFIQEAALTALEDYDATTETMRTIYGRRLALVSQRSGRSPGSRRASPRSRDVLPRRRARHGSHVLRFCLGSLSPGRRCLSSMPRPSARRQRASSASLSRPATNASRRLATGSRDTRKACRLDDGRQDRGSPPVGGVARSWSRFSSIQSARAATLVAASRPSGVRLYSTCGGTTGESTPIDEPVRLKPLQRLRQHPFAHPAHLAAVTR